MSDNKEKAVGVGLGFLANPLLQWTLIILFVVGIIYLGWTTFKKWWENKFGGKTEFGGTGFLAHTAAAFGFATNTGKKLENAEFLNDPTVTSDFSRIDTSGPKPVGYGTVLAGSNDTYVEPWRKIGL